MLLPAIAFIILAQAVPDATNWWIPPGTSIPQVLSFERPNAKPEDPPATDLRAPGRTEQTLATVELQEVRTIDGTPTAIFKVTNTTDIRLTSARLAFIAVDANGTEVYRTAGDNSRSIVLPGESVEVQAPIESAAVVITSFSASTGPGSSGIQSLNIRVQR